LLVEAVEMDGALRQLLLSRLVDIQCLAEIERVGEVQRRRFRRKLAQLRNILLLQLPGPWVLDFGNGKNLGCTRERQTDRDKQNARPLTISHISLPMVDTVDPQPHERNLQRL